MAQPSTPEINKLKLHRLIFFTDAVLAIILTLLVIELHLPQLTNADSAEEMGHKLLHMWPHFASFLLCFLQMAQAWLGFTLMDSLLARFNNTLATLRLLMLLPLSLLPFGSSLIGNYFTNPMSFAFFGCLGLCSSIVQVFTHRYLWKNNMFITELDRAYFQQKVLKRIWTFPLFALALIGISFINTYLAFGIYLLMMVLGIISMRWVKFTKED